MAAVQSAMKSATPQRIDGRQREPARPRASTRRPFGSRCFARPDTNCRILTDSTRAACGVLWNTVGRLPSTVRLAPHPHADLSRLAPGFPNCRWTACGRFCARREALPRTSSACDHSICTAATMGGLFLRRFCARTSRGRATASTHIKALVCRRVRRVQSKSTGGGRVGRRPEGQLVRSMIVAEQTAAPGVEHLTPGGNERLRQVG